MNTMTLRTAMMVTALFSDIAGMQAQVGYDTLEADTIRSGLELNIEIETADQRTDGTTVRIYQDNRFVAVLNSTLQPEMKVILQRNKYYLLAVEKPGYTEKSILISTFLPDTDGKKHPNNTEYEHSVSIWLDKKTTQKKKPGEQLIGILYYDAKRDEYIGSPMKNDAPDKEAIISQLENWLGL